MTTTPQTWHYGLVAQWWAEFNTDGPEIAYFQQCIERYGQPALDVACGTGRLLLPYLHAGLDVEGCDISTEDKTGGGRSVGTDRDVADSRCFVARRKTGR